jgi:hypothetical protein
MVGDEKTTIILHANSDCASIAFKPCCVRDGLLPLSQRFFLRELNAVRGCSSACEAATSRKDSHLQIQVPTKDTHTAWRGCIFEAHLGLYWVANPEYKTYYLE